MRHVSTALSAVFFMCAAPAVVLAQAPCTVSTFGTSVPAAITPLSSGPVFTVLDRDDVTLADFNGDLASDIAIANAERGAVEIVLGAGAGRFVRGASLSARQTSSVAAADFNQDGRTDLVVSYRDVVFEQALGVFPGLGDGTFASPLIIGVLQSVTKLTTADFTGDGLADIAGIIHAPGASVALFQGDGAGTFADPVYFPLGGTVHDLVSGDFNGDARLDLAAAAQTIETPSPSIRLLFGTASGGFTGPSVMPIGKLARNLVPADFEGDGDLDLALGLIGLDDVEFGVSLLRGDGAGGFSGGGIVAVSAWRFGNIATGDFDGDGLPDLAVPNLRDESFPNGLTRPVSMVDILYADGAGGFRDAVSFVVGEQLDYLGAAEVNADGRVDLVAVTVAFQFSLDDRHSAVALLNTCGATVDAAVTFAESVDPVHNGNPLTYTIDVSNLGPDAGPIVLRMMVGEDHFNFVDVTTTHGRCRMGSVLMCWFGILDSGETAQVILEMKVIGSGVFTTTARVTSGGQDPDMTNNVYAELVRVALLGGQNMRLAHAPGGPVRLTWLAGDYQAAYYIGRYTSSGLTVFPTSGVPLPRDATTFIDDSPVQGELNCYMVTPVDASGTQIGRSDMLCVKPGTASGQAPTDFSISLQGSIAGPRWSGPGGQTGYLLIAQPLDGGPQTQIPRNSGSTGYNHNTDGKNFCYVIVPGNGFTPLGASDVLCAYPGLSDLDPSQ